MRFMFVAIFLAACSAEHLPAELVREEPAPRRQIADWHTEEYRVQCATAISDALILEDEIAALREELKQAEAER